jgi:5-methylcytosine-specific restriction enzyme A
MKRRKVTAKMRLLLFLKSQGQCQSCRAKIHPGQKWELDHIIPLALGGPDSDSNLQVLCKICHAHKTTTRDTPTIAKVKRMKVKHLGAKPIQTQHPLPCGKSSPWKKKINGQIVRRGENENERTQE